MSYEPSEKCPNCKKTVPWLWLNESFHNNPVGYCEKCFMVLIVGVPDQEIERDGYGNYE